jgi:hypothetical protein
MADNYTETLTKLQHQSLDVIKKIQETQVETLASIRKMVADIPAPTMPTTESLPTIEKLVELNTSFATAVFEQQKHFVTEIGNLFGAMQKDATAAVERITKPTSSNN